jgi:hypothetical protein
LSARAGVEARAQLGCTAMEIGGGVQVRRGECARRAALHAQSGHIDADPALRRGDGAGELRIHAERAHRVELGDVGLRERRRHATQ